MAAEIEKFLPHRAPMVMVDELIEFEGDSARAVKEFGRSDYEIEEGFVTQSLLIEALAQTVAAMFGREAAQKGLPPAIGMLTGVKDFRFGRKVRAEERVSLEVAVTRRLAPFAFAEGRALCGSEVVAEGSMRFYIEENPGETHV